MKKQVLFLIICFLSFSVFAQDAITTELQNAYQQRQYDAIIAEHAAKINEYPAKAIYYVGMAYYMKSDDQNVIKLMDMSIGKDNSDPDAYYIKAMSLNYMEQYPKAIEAFKTAIKLDDANANYHSGLGDSYLNTGKYELALSAYTAATEKENHLDRPYAMIPQIYAELGKSEKALKAFYISKEKVSKESSSYITALYNIGLYEYLNENYEASEKALTELVTLAPEDFQSYTKLIQVFYAKKEYDKAKPYVEKLYKAYEQGVLKGVLKNMFCFDQFVWKDKRILAYERFAEKEGELYYKHVFYVTGKDGNSEFTIQTENSPISIEMGGPKYILGMDKDGTHSTFKYGFEKDFNYVDLKKTVLVVLEGKVKPSASSTKVKKQ
ncbi:tetratricopeptide repeat protein [Kordia sp.]|uniref:tetratricopeptide repeat protein n=1 Tax=Kordia sp. TaxID=1965332 RepID=UPI0025BFDC1B|nr:tetratricopeptide repeat protein [Kordia sp.]MCH2196521.1 tetratricopeptide repeat protein [Kordia sp.]